MNFLQQKIKMKYDSRENTVQKCPSDLYWVEKPVRMNRIK